MLYLGIFFFLIGAWLAYMPGSMSQAISGISLVLGTIFVFMGDWKAGLFFILMFATWFLLMQIFRFSTYHKYFAKTVIILGLYAGLIGFLFNKLGFEKYFWWYLGLSSLFLIYNHIKQRQVKSLLNTVEGKERDDLEFSFNNTIKYHLLSSVVFIVIVGLSFLYNTGNLKFDTNIATLTKVGISANVEHFNKSLDFKNKATKVSNAGGDTQKITEVEAMVRYNKQALQEALLVDIQQLNSAYSGFGDHYKNEFIKGIELFNDGFEKNDSKMFLEGQILLDHWSTWFDDNFEAIKKS